MCDANIRKHKSQLAPCEHKSKPESNLHSVALALVSVCVRVLELN